MNNKTTIELTLTDGTFDGIVTVNHKRARGKLIKIPRKQANDDYTDKDSIKAELKELNNSGVYLLLGQKADEEEAIYIGQSDNVYKRLNEHITAYRSGRKSFYWTTAVVYTREKMDQTSLLYLEYQLCQMAKKYGRYACLTKIVNKHHVSEGEVSDLDYEIATIEIMLRALACDAVAPVSIVKKHAIVLHLKDDNGTDAKGFYRDGKFVIKKDSKISDTVHENIKSDYLKERERLQSHQNGTIKDGIFTKDCSFDTITPATAVICGRNVAAKTLWKTEEGISLKDCENLNVN